MAAPARKLRAYSVMYANKLVTTRRAIENKITPCSQVMEPGASNNPPGPHLNLLSAAFVMEVIQGSSEPTCPLFLN
eukprot:1153243-Pelagomonas_calceolata.AAC.1